MRLRQSAMKVFIQVLLFLSLFICVSASYGQTRVAFIADPQIGFTDFQQDTVQLDLVVTAINTRNVDFTVILGDLANNGEDDNGQQRACRTVLDRSNSSLLYVPGNHEYADNVGNCTASIDTFKTYFPYPPPGTTGSDSVWVANIGNNWIMLGIDTGCGSSGNRYSHRDSLQKYITLHQDKFIIIVSHYGIWSTINRSGGIQGGGDVVIDINQVMNLLHLSSSNWDPVRFVINGHRHFQCKQQITHDGKQRTVNEFVMSRCTQVGNRRRVMIVDFYSDSKFSIDWIYQEDL